MVFKCRVFTAYKAYILRGTVIIVESYCVTALPKLGIFPELPVTATPKPSNSLSFGFSATSITSAPPIYRLWV